MAGDIVIQTINIAVVPVPMPPVAGLLFIVAARSQEVALLPEAELLAARVSHTGGVVDAVGNK
jgi:hypothetical protein